MHDVDEDRPDYRRGPAPVPEPVAAPAGNLDRRAIRAAIDACRLCDDAGRDDDLNNCPRHPNFRQAGAR